jgi:RNA recognition motif-containing protein
MNIYVGNLSYNTTESELRNEFEAFGQVAAVKIIADRETGRPRGFAFVEMDNDQEARAAIEGVNGKQVGGRNLTVNEARPREERSGGRSGGGDRGSRGRRW